MKVLFGQGSTVWKGVRSEKERKDKIRVADNIKDATGLIMAQVARKAQNGDA